jgi:tetratricopeptide (TPR) repeat protein
MRRKLSRSLTLCGTSLLLSACAAKSGANIETKVPQIERRAPDLESAAEELDRGRPLVAVSIYRELLQGSSLETADRRTALVGLADAQIALGDFAAAEISLREVIKIESDPIERVTRSILASACAAEMEEWERAWEVLEPALGTVEKISADLVFELTARAALALFQRDRLDDAEIVLTNAEKIYDARIGKEKERLRSRYFWAMNRFYRAAIEHRRFQRRTLSNSAPQQAQDFAAKVAYFDAAQHYYRETVKVGHARWISAASYQMGVIAGELYDAIIAVPIPDSLPAEEHAEYYRELAKRVAPLVERSAKTFQRGIETSERFGYADEFVERSRANLERLRAIGLDTSAGRAGPLPRLALEDDSNRAPIGNEEPGNPLGTQPASSTFIPQPSTL